MGDTAEEEQRKIFLSLCLEEYKVLRAESVRCMQLISNTIWIGLSGYVITLGAMAAVLKLYPGFLPLVLILLAMQALSASVMFLAEVRKYARVGLYIREKIEKAFLPADVTDITKIPLCWEHWLSEPGNRTRLFYAVSLMVLQLPVLGIITLAFASVVLDVLPTQGLARMGELLAEDVIFHAAMAVIAVLDILIIGYFVAGIYRQRNSPCKSLTARDAKIA